MICPKCNSRDTRVADSRVARNGRAIRRRRQCTECGYRFTTAEEVLREGLLVLKRDGRREEFDRAKMIAGIRKACEKRPVDVEQIDLLISDVMVDLEREFDQEIPSQAIGERIMARLKTIDPIAYIRFASVYKDFDDIDDLVRAIAELKQARERLAPPS